MNKTESKSTKGFLQTEGYLNEFHREYCENERGEWIHDASCPWEKTWVPES